MDSEQVIWPLTDYLKREILTIRTNIGNYLKKYRLEDESNSFSRMRKDFYKRQFITELILLYSKVRASILRSKEKEFESLRVRRWEMKDPSYDIDEWIKIFVQLEAFLDNIGITRLEVDREDMDTLRGI